VSAPANASPRHCWRHPEGALPGVLALAYVGCAHAAGLALLVFGGLLVFVVGVALVAHSLVVAAYLIHECTHRLVFLDVDANHRLGEVLSWLCGTSYASFGRIERMHLRHHADRADVVCFDLQGFLRGAPAWLRRAVLALEWAHVPACELLMHAQVMVRPFYDPTIRHERRRVLATGASRIAFFWLLFAANPWSLAGYALAWLLFVKALFLADAFAHTYPFYAVASEREPVPREGRDARFDMEHTWSNLVSTRCRFANLYNLNFGYHNAHHARPAEPWFRLPQVHAQLFTADASQVLPYREVWRSFHRNRVHCVLAEEMGGVGEGPGRADAFQGVHGVSFLSIV
jgi:fatty acid desaturase